ncbi:hypothetical protein [Teichococcus coralli]|uniref:hypothetical protein n=1 Tax=Teichococcus coralli TaxID=2545983 RepID=UPI0019297208|nr:hypothetical protein [Pseudoroseomonas coralli]
MDAAAQASGAPTVLRDGGTVLPAGGQDQRREAAERDGVRLRDGIPEALRPWAAKLGVALP